MSLNTLYNNIVSKISAFTDSCSKNNVSEEINQDNAIDAFSGITGGGSLKKDSDLNLNKPQDNDSVCGLFNSLIKGDYDSVYHVAYNQVADKWNAAVDKNLNELKTETYRQINKITQNSYFRLLDDAMKKVKNAGKFSGLNTNKIIDETKNKMDKTDISTLGKSLLKQITNNNKIYEGIYNTIDIATNAYNSTSTNSGSFFTNIIDAGENVTNMKNCRAAETAIKNSSYTRSLLNKYLTTSIMNDSVLNALAGLGIKSDSLNNISFSDSYIIGDITKSKGIDLFDSKTGIPDLSLLPGVMSYGEASKIAKATMNQLPSEDNILTNNDNIAIIQLTKIQNDISKCAENLDIT